MMWYPNLHHSHPQGHFATLHFITFRVALNLIHDTLNLLQLKVDDVVHDALGNGNVFLEEIEIEIGLRSEGVYYV